MSAAQGEYQIFALDAWRTDVADAIMEVDGNCNVKQANLDACILFGYPAAGLKSTNLAKLFQINGGKSGKFLTYTHS